MLRPYPGKQTAEVHDYHDVHTGVLAAIHYPALLGEPFPLLAYPMEAMLAEKLVTIVARGDTTTRGRHFGDVLLLARHHDIDAASLSDAITATAAFRRVELRPISETLVTEIAPIAPPTRHPCERRFSGVSPGRCRRLAAGAALSTSTPGRRTSPPEARSQSTQWLHRRCRSQLRRRRRRR